MSELSVLFACLRRLARQAGLAGNRGRDYVATVNCAVPTKENRRTKKSGGVPRLTL